MTTTDLGESGLEVTAATAAGAEVGGETEVGLAMGGVTTAGPGGDSYLESEELTHPESWIASSTLCREMPCSVEPFQSL